MGGRGNGMTIMDAISEMAPLKIRLSALDDHIEELEPLRAIAATHNIEPSFADTVTAYGEMLDESTEDDILISDNFIEGVNDLKAIGEVGIKTGSGTNAGTAILTEYCDRRAVNAGLKIVWTQWVIKGDTKRRIERWRDKKGEKIYALHKHKQDDIDLLNEIVECHVGERMKIFLSKKFNYVSKLFDDWKLTAPERNKLFGLTASDDSLQKLVEHGTTMKDVEARCDLIYRIKENLALVYGGDDLEQEVAWLRTRNSTLGDETPLAFLGQGFQHRLAELVMRMEGPY
jgi:hypothetical protein